MKTIQVCNLKGHMHDLTMHGMKYMIYFYHKCRVAHIIATETCLLLL